VPSAASSDVVGAGNPVKEPVECRFHRKRVVWLLGLVVMSSCSMSKDIDTARRAVGQFHKQMAAGKDDAIYKEADRSYRQAMTREAHDAFFARIRRKMGRFESSTNTGYFIDVGTKGTLVSLRYKTQWANGDLDERFVWRLYGGRAFLVRYEASSPLLLTSHPAQGTTTRQPCGLFAGGAYVAF
jgi:hypothetical protein